MATVARLPGRFGAEAGLTNPATLALVDEQDEGDRRFIESWVE